MVTCSLAGPDTLGFNSREHQLNVDGYLIFSPISKFNIHIGLEEQAVSKHVVTIRGERRI